MNTVIIFFTALFATTLSSMSGGGSSAIIIPVLISLGIPFPIATSSQKVSATCWVLPASYNYLKDRKVNWFFLLMMSAVGLVGVYFGVQLIVSINPRVMQVVIGFLILFLVIYTLLKKDMGIVEEKVYSRVSRASAYGISLILGFYESIFGSGNGILFSIVALKTYGFSFADALGYYFSVSFFWTLFAAILLIQKGYFNLPVMLPVLVGSLIGGYIGSRYAKYKGNKFIKIMFVAVGTLLALKLLIG